eukprot:s422_g9.t1
MLTVACGITCVEVEGHLKRQGGVVLGIQLEKREYAAASILYAGNTAYLSELRSKHHARAHPDVPKHVLCKRYKLEVAKVTDAIPREEMAWKCPLRPKGLPCLDSKRARMLAVSAQKKECHPDAPMKEWKGRMFRQHIEKGKKYDSFREQPENARGAAQETVPYTHTHKLIEVVMGDDTQAAKHDQNSQWWCANCLSKPCGHGGSQGPAAAKGFTCKQVRALPNQKARLRWQWQTVKDKKPASGQPLWRQLGCAIWCKMAMWSRTLVHQ